MGSLPNSSKDLTRVEAQKHLPNPNYKRSAEVRGLGRADRPMHSYFARSSVDRPVLELVDERYRECERIKPHLADAWQVLLLVVIMFVRTETHASNTQAWGKATKSLLTGDSLVPSVRLIRAKEHATFPPCIEMTAKHPFPREMGGDATPRQPPMVISPAFWGFAGQHQLERLHGVLREAQPDTTRYSPHLEEGEKDGWDGERQLGEGDLP